jgi:hypothetical protein
VGSVRANGGDLYWDIRLMDAAASSYRNGTANETGTLPNRCEGTADFLTDPVFEIAATSARASTFPSGSGSRTDCKSNGEATPTVVKYDCTGGPDPQTTLTGQLTEVVDK